MPSLQKHSWNWPSTPSAAKAARWASVASTRLPAYGDRCFPHANITSETECVRAAGTHGRLSLTRHSCASENPPGAGIPRLQPEEIYLISYDPDPVLSTSKQSAGRHG